MFGGLSKIFKAAPSFHTGGVVGLKAGEVPAVLQSPEALILLRPGESQVVADEIAEIKATTAKKKSAHAARIEKLRAADEEKAAGWDAWWAARGSLQRQWEAIRDQQIADLPMHEPFLISQDSDGWWRVAPAEIYNDFAEPNGRSGGDYAPAIEVGSCRVGVRYKPFDPTFKTFAEATDYAKETALLGKHTYSVDDHGDIVSCSDPEGLAHLAPFIQASKDAQVRQADRTAAYAQEALF